MTDQPEKLDLNSLDISAEKRQELLDLFPEARTEDGKIDFDRLKLALGETVDVGKERYGMNWPGKADCFRAIQTPSAGTLLPCPEESVNFNTTENLIIEGDNLEVLKLMQKSYLGKVKMIYIDPPYNTGNDFIYPDNYTESLQTYLEYTSQVDAEGRKFGTNSDTDGRFHSRWINMMYPRLYLAKNLLQQDGLVFISIDDTEFENLKRICDEIFGEENFVNVLIWKKRYNAAKEQQLAVIHEYVIIYAKNRFEINEFFVSADDNYYESMFTEEDEFIASRGKFMTQPLEAGNSMGDRPNLRFPITAPDGTKIFPRRQWVWGKEKVDWASQNGYLKFYKNSSNEWKVRHKHYSKDENGEFKKIKPFSILDKIYTQDGTKEIEDIFSIQNIFPFPKPSKLIKHLIELSDNDNGIFLDFFSGSGTTAHAVLDLNKEDAGNRKFILVQLPEPCDNTSEAGRAGYSTIAEITKERVRRVIQKLNDSEAGQLPLEAPQDRGFRVFKLDASNFKPWDANTPKDAQNLERQLDLHVEHILPDRSQKDILYEILLKSGFPLTTPIETLTLAEKQVFSIAGRELLICLESELTMEAIRAIAALRPERVVCLDAGFAGNDQLKANAVQIFKTQGVPSFKTV